MFLIDCDNHFVYLQKETRFTQPLLYKFSGTLGFALQGVSKNEKQKVSEASVT